MVGEEREKFTFHASYHSTPIMLLGAVQTTAGVPAGCWQTSLTVCWFLLDDQWHHRREFEAETLHSYNNNV